MSPKSDNAMPAVDPLLTTVSVRFRASYFDRVRF
jgi:hypothetical protein